MRSDSDWMEATARLSVRARPSSRPNPSVAAIVVADGRIVGRGWTMPGGRPHAEAVALDQAGKASAGATMYTTLEPCAHRSERGPCCTDLICAAGLARVVVGTGDPDPRTAGNGLTLIEAAGIAVNLLENPAAIASLQGHLIRQRLGRPHVTLKLAMSLDGCIARADGESRWITGDLARAHVHAQRAHNDVVLVGGGTWRADRPSLDVRLPGLADRSPERWVLSSAAELDGAQTIAAPTEIAHIEGANYLYVEGGAVTASSFLEAGLVDCLHVYRAPILIGDGLRALGDIGLASLPDAHCQWRMTERRQLGSDIFEAYERVQRKDPPCSPE